MSLRAGIILAAIATALPGFAQQAPNLVVNPGFEDGLSGWEAVNPVGEAASVAVSGEGAFAGAGSLRVSVSTDDLRPVGARQTIAVEPGRYYYLAVRARNTELKSSGGVRLRVFDAAGGQIKRDWPLRLNTWRSNWRLMEQYVRMPGRAATVELLLAVNGRGEAWYDEVTLVRRDPPTNPALEKVEQIPLGITVTRFNAPAPVLKMRACDLEGDGIEEVLLGDVEGRLHLMRAGRVVWSVDLGGLACDIACGDRDGDGIQEIAVATMNLHEDIIVLSADGERIWSHPVDDNYCSRVTWADFHGNGSRDLIVSSGAKTRAYDADFAETPLLDVGGPRTTALTAADLDGDGRDEVLVGYSAQVLRVVAVDGGGDIQWRYSPSDWSGGTAVSSLFVADIDGDGGPEVVGGCDGSVAFALDADGTPIWRSPGRGWPNETFLAEPVALAGGTQVLLMGRHSVEVRAGAGPRIFATDTPLTIIDSSASVTKPDVCWLASSGTRDASCYRIVVSESGENELADFTLPDPIGAELDKVWAQVAVHKVLPLPEGSDRRFHVLLYRNNRKQVQAAWPQLAARNTPNIDYQILSYVKELPVELHRFPQSSHEEILDYAAFFEAEGIPFWLFVCHGARPWITPDTAREIIQLAPTACRGFYTAEDTSLYARPIFYEWLDWAGEMLAICHAAGRRMIFKEMFDTWSLVASDRRCWDVLFKYPETIIPMYATNNGHAPEVQIGGMLGLWRAGACREWGMSSQNWNWNWAESCYSRVSTSTICPPDVILRMDLAAASLGCTWFHVEGGQEWMSRDGRIVEASMRHRELLYQMMQRGLLLPPAPEQLAGLSPVAVARTTDLSGVEGAGIGTPRGRLGT
ncbi:MAG: VCBS repeat-containing protein, partial [Armatimonadetes bacterium]|nr:VCBS repeat-containing protein [Armatimonadota bacterium]